MKRAELTRRAILSLTALLPAKALANNASGEAVLSAQPPAKSAAGRRWVSPPNCYFAYPHNNSFLPGNGLPVVARIDNEGITYCTWNFRQGSLQAITRTGLGYMYWEVARHSETLFFVAGRKRIVSVSTKPQGLAAGFDIHHDSNEKLEALLAVRADASRVLYMEEGFTDDMRAIRAARLIELTVRDGGTAQICAAAFNADHQQYCPFDEDWIGFAHEGDVRRTRDRIWGFDRAGGGAAAVLWNEIAADGGTVLVGHERWAFHAAGTLAVAYPGSTGRPRGLYFVDAPRRRARLISASAYDWHCNISQDGVWAVVDTQPPPGQPAEPDGRIISDVVLVHMATGQRQWVARSHASPRGHPWHPHPHFSPDGRYVIYNDFAAAGAGTPGRIVMTELVPAIPV